MDFDFNLILVPATLIFFGLWLLDKFVLKQRATKGKGNENFIITWAYDFWPVLAVVLVLRSFFFEPFNIPSDSMVPTLETGDYILVNKYQYGVRLPITNTKVLDIGEPQRGDVAVFRYPENPKISYIKRIIGLPGDHIEFDNGQLIINGQKISQVTTEFSREKDILDTPKSIYYTETMGEHQHLVRILEGQNTLVGAFNYAQKKEDLPFVARDNDRFIKSNGQSWEVTVPKGKYFAMGDNRDQSADSRFWGFVPEENLTGHAIYVWMHKEPGLNFPSFSRNGKIN
ncbi:signal peptidase I [Acinetobacter sichuanensis]|uniref:Signal peptidase I n=1 Tax=Acinetobacter sichuanensis TaxID=2136183 RepID=A0A371YUG6_9GAMM|nr:MULTISPECIES: signal peptidase I [Acinetobacter]MDM1246845.1 signal peptidase I [Acinetobacter sp. R933-2]MDM1763541.1 signal peptidase I [Acinetobacter sp. 226-1]MDM1767020.1 signal peptidase I [Acinetobacter sp. 226-4]MDQ9019736.1 signal peptidase I [Acinetobacter sichuanensis]RFC85034.1 signal peptidase I [Acinetobacter sichuanensis]